MIDIRDKSQCCGCSACASICPQKAISMKPDAMGFLYPRVDVDKCIVCGLCLKVCSFNECYDTSQNIEKAKVYAVRHKDIEKIRKSRSGAMFVAISDYVLEEGGVIYGAGYTDYFRVVHKRATTKEERDEFRGSKYVQSDLNNVFLQVKNDLSNGLLVLFSGTPCQTSGLNSFISKKYRDRLILVDIVCHGVPSPSIWRDYLRYQERKYNSKIVKVDFRDKSLGWTEHKESLLFENNKLVYSSIYTDLFYGHLMFRPSCEKCYFTNFMRPSDITLGDFWGWKRVDKSINSDDLGCSLVLCNTNKGISIFNKVSSELNYIETTQNMCEQPNLLRPSVFSDKYGRFQKNYKRWGFGFILAKYSNIGWISKCKKLYGKILFNIKHRFFI